MAPKAIHEKQTMMPLQCHYADTDMGGVIHHASYLRFMERARDEWYEQLDFNIFAWHKRHLYLAVHHMTLNYQRSVDVWHRFEMVTRLIAMTRVSLTFSQQIRLAEQPDSIYFAGEIAIVAIDNHGRPQRIPKALTEKIEVTS
ncbi:MAG: hypothetical protein GY821_07550 [Gammaproteobacteria bacterium]|nr:hypothetical protein [Gammaproteobacteria bacterium]MCP4474410.1 hypothetical protein [Gammaproteobacteria bacterium]